jgi:two-component system chemotaxis sensor kinase CheA
MGVLTGEQMRALFAQEAEVRLVTLGRLLLELERSGTDEALIGSLFRELHTIKGSSAVAGLADVSALAHELEDLVQELREGGYEL